MTFDPLIFFTHSAIMFKSSQKKDLSFYIKEMFWPRMGFKRTAQYMAVRVMRLSAASDSVPRGFACGITASFLPVFGIHALFAMAMAFIIRANVIAAALGTLLFPPVVLPLVFSLDFWIGEHILRLIDYSIPTLGTEGAFEQFSSFFLPALTGSVVLMLIAWPLTYLATHKIIALVRAHYNAKKQS